MEAKPTDGKFMQNIKLDDIEKVEYQDTLTKGHLSSIQVIFSKAKHGAIRNYFGPGLTLAFTLLNDQFPPQTEVERRLIERPVPTPIDFDIDPNTLEVSAPPDKLKDLRYVQLMAASKQAEDFGYFSSGGRSFNIERLHQRIKTEIERKKPQA
jgi:hypothetical protein